MTKRILWIEDDAYALGGLFLPLQKQGCQVELALSALDGYNKLKNWQVYDLIVVDMILALHAEDAPVPETVKNWAKEKFVGLGIVKYLIHELKVTCPVMILSIVVQGDLGIEDTNVRVISKVGITPGMVKEEIQKILGL